MPFEIFQQIRSVSFSLGFCETLEIREGKLFPLQPFSKMQLFVPGGWIDCRGDWHGPRYLQLVENIEVHPVPIQLWMHISMVDAIRAIDLCRDCAVDLGREGFTRIPL